MNPIDIIKENLEAMATMPEYDQDDAHRLRNMAKNTLTALDSLTIKVTNEEIERVAEEACLKFLSKPVDPNANQMFDTPTALYVLRHARDNWLAPSQWISVETRLPVAEEPVLTFKKGDGYWVQWVDVHNGWQNGSEPTHWQLLPSPPNPTE